MNQISNVSLEVAPTSKAGSLWRVSKMGYKFDFNSDIWQLDGSKTINLGIMRNLETDTKLGLRNALCRYAEELSGSFTGQILSYFNMYCDQTGMKNVSVSGLTKWRSSLSTENEYLLGALRGFFISWNDWGYPGVTSDVVKFLEEISLKGNVKGKAVKRACPYSGPLTQIEQGALLEWSSNAFIEKKLNLTEYAFFLTLAFTGRRAVQIRSLRCCDLIKDQKKEEYSLRLPRAKQSGMGFRQVFRTLSINEDL
jgi:hypothetical protein